MINRYLTQRGQDALLVLSICIAAVVVVWLIE